MASFRKLGKADYGAIDANDSDEEEDATTTKPSTEDINDKAARGIEAAFGSNKDLTQQTSIPLTINSTNNDDEKQFESIDHTNTDQATALPIFTTLKVNSPQNANKLDLDQSSELQKEVSSAMKQISIRPNCAPLLPDNGDVSFMNEDKGTSKENKLDPRTEIIELPRDVLTAYMLIHLETDGHKALWDQYSCLGKAGIIMAVATPFAIQWFVAATLLASENFNFEDAEKITAAGDVKVVWYELHSVSSEKRFSD